MSSKLVQSTSDSFLRPAANSEATAAACKLLVDPERSEHRHENVGQGT